MKYGREKLHQGVLLLVCLIDMMIGWDQIHDLTIKPTT